MKKFVAIVLTLVMALALVSCGSKGQTQAPAQDASNQTTDTPGSSQAAASLDWPKKTIQITVGYAAGGDTDLYARTCAKYLEEKLGVTVVVINTTGASGVTGAISVMDSAADGYNVLFNHYGCLVNEATGTAGISFVDDMAQACTVLVDNSYTLCASKDCGLEDWDDLVAYATAHPDELTIAANANSNGYDIVQQIEDAAGIQIKQVEGSGSASERIAAILGGQHDLIYANYSLLSDYIENGDLIVMGSIGTERCAAHTDVPCLTELIGKDIISPYIFSFRFPADTDEAILDYFDSVMEEICADEAFKAEIEHMGGNVYFTDRQTSYDAQVESLAEIKVRLGV